MFSDRDPPDVGKRRQRQRNDAIGTIAPEIDAPELHGAVPLQSSCGVEAGRNGDDITQIRRDVQLPVLIVPSPGTHGAVGLKGEAKIPSRGNRLDIDEPRRGLNRRAAGSAPSHDIIFSRVVVDDDLHIEVLRRLAATTRHRRNFYPVIRIIKSCSNLQPGVAGVGARRGQVEELTGESPRNPQTMYAPFATESLVVKFCRRPIQYQRKPSR